MRSQDKCIYAKALDNKYTCTLHYCICDPDSIYDCRNYTDSWALNPDYDSSDFRRYLNQ